MYERCDPYTYEPDRLGTGVEAGLVVGLSQEVAGGCAHDTSGAGGCVEGHTPGDESSEAVALRGPCAPGGQQAQLEYHAARPETLAAHVPRHAVRQPPQYSFESGEVAAVFGEGGLFANLLGVAGRLNLGVVNA